MNMEALNDAINKWTNAIYPGYLPNISPLLEAARLVLSAVPAEGAVEAARTAYSKRGGISCHPEAMQAALHAAAIWQNARLDAPSPSREEVAKIVEAVKAARIFEHTAIDRIMDLFGRKP